MHAKLFEPFRSELLAHCYRMLGSPHAAEDVLQDVMARAWLARSSFDERSSLRTWLYRIATNVCIDEIRRVRRRRELPVGHGTPIDGDDPTPPAREPARFIGPFPDRALVGADDADPEAKYLSTESIRLAFIAALQRLTARQRAVLILHDVMGFRASEIATMLRASTSAVNSALHRARVVTKSATSRREDLSRIDHDLLDRYVTAWVAGDAESVAALLAKNATFSMPPNPAWLRGKRAVQRYLARVVLSSDRSRRFVETRANGTHAFGVYMRKASERGPHRAHGLHVITFANDEIADIVSFHDPAVFPLFGLAPEVR